MSHGQANELVSKLEEAGLTPEMAQAVINSPDNQLAIDTVNRLQRSLRGFTTWGDAIDIFGRSALSISIAKGLRINVPSANFYDNIPASRAELVKFRRRLMFIVAMPAVNLINLQHAAPLYFDEHNWRLFDQEPFTRTVSRPGHHLMYPALFGSGFKTWSEQLEFRPRDMGTPSAVELAYAAIAWHLVNNEVLLSRRWVRCSDSVPDAQVALKQFPGGQVILSFTSDQGRSEDLEIACRRYLTDQTVPPAA